MNCDYSDITDRLGEPQWWDERAVPRYCEFSPRESANIYAAQIALALITCQDCGREFQVCFSVSRTQLATDPRSDISEAIRARTLHYGDPPNIGCCHAGPTMNSVPRRVLEYWDLSGGASSARRDHSLEVDITPAWASDTEGDY